LDEPVAAGGVLAKRGAGVGVIGIAVVALLTWTDVGVAANIVNAPVEAGLPRSDIRGARIALLCAVYEIVPADESCTEGSAVHVGAVEGAVVALFCPLDDAISAAACNRLAVCRAAVAVDSVAVITCLTRLEYGVATGAAIGRVEGAHRALEIATVESKLCADAAAERKGGAVTVFRTLDDVIAT
jgi:hypothetical protein